MDVVDGVVEGTLFEKLHDFGEFYSVFVWGTDFFIDTLYHYFFLLNEGACLRIFGFAKSDLFLKHFAVVLLH